MLGVFVVASQALGAFKPSTAPISQFSDVLARLAKAPHSHTATDLVLAAIGYT
jgi:hypothetical protein